MQENSRRVDGINELKESVDQKESQITEMRLKRAQEIDHYQKRNSSSGQFHIALQENTELKQR